LKYRRVLTLRTFRDLTFQLPRASASQIQEGFNPPDIQASYIPVAPGFSPGREMIEKIPGL
jgi:hypothetical protein